MQPIRKTLFNTFIGVTTGLQGPYYYQRFYPEGCEIVYHSKQAYTNNYARARRILEEECLNIFLTTFTASLYIEGSAALKISKVSKVPFPIRTVSLAAFAHLFCRYRGMNSNERSL